MEKGLVDSFGRVHDYLRISLTDRCNFACLYCRPQQYCFLPGKEKMTSSEIIGIASIFASLGVRKIRLTGGEPLLHTDFDSIVRNLTEIVPEVAVTTNGYYLDRHFPVLKTTGVSSVNISLDSLKPEKFKRLSLVDGFQKVYSNILSAIRAGISTHINVVVIRGENDDEILDFVRLTKDFPVSVRFIELMPFARRLKKDKLVSWKETYNIIAKDYVLHALPSKPHSTAQEYFIENHSGSVGFISPVTNNFCSSCNRLRLTADGKIKNCLFSNQEIDLLGSLRSGKWLEDIIRQIVAQKGPGGSRRINISDRPMVAIGG